MAEKTKVIIIEDNPEMRFVLQTYIESSQEFILMAAYDNCEDAIKNIKITAPRIVLMDVDLPGINGIEGTKKIKQKSKNTDVIIITVFENSEVVFSALKAGASGYLTKTFVKEELVNAIYECINGGAPMSMKIAKMVVNSFNKNVKSPLTERETEVLTCLSEGKSYNGTANQLYISLDTVKYHIKNIYLKLQVSSKGEALEIANREKYI